MGYTTWYTINTQENTYKISDIASYMNKKYMESDWFYPFDVDDYLDDNDVYDFEIECEEWNKWYEHDEEMLELSKHFPNVVFCLDGEGEENGDIWRTYYKNGKKQYCPAKIIFDDYDERKLK